MDKKPAKSKNLYEELSHPQLTRFNGWFRPKGIRAALLIVLIVLLIGGTYWFVYATGGITYVYSHSMYIPIFLAALFFRMPGGIIAGIIGGFVLGPIMPLDIHTGEMQTTINWVYRLFIFSITGGFLGFITSVVDHQIRRIEWQFYHNPLTEMPNRSYLELTLSQLIQNNHSGKQSAVFLIKLNNFDEISNTFGIENSVTILNQLSERVKQLIPDAPVCELVPTLLGMVKSFDEIKIEIKETIHTLMRITQEPFSIEEVPIFLDICIGVAIYPDHGDNSSIIIRKATTAAITAQMKSLNYWVYEDSLDLLSKDRMALLGSVNAAIKGGQLVVYYQPILNIASGEVAGVEALIRWQHPERGLIPPGDFIHLLEDTSLIFTFQEWLIDTIFNQIKTWNSLGYKPSCSINLSARGLNHLRLEKPINKILEQYDIAPNQVMFEITESVVMLDPQEALLSLTQLKQAGFKLAIDDFGTGYSSLNYLKNLPVDYLKIDLDFIREVDQSEKDQEIVRAILTSARALGLKVIAEGVETCGGLKWLKAEKCRYAQGYFFARPMPAAAVTKWMENFSFDTITKKCL